MEKVSIVLVGAAGFGNAYVQSLFTRISPDCFELRGIVDPFVQNSLSYAQILERKIPLYDSLEEFYAEHEVDLVFISSPIQFHIQQIRCAFAHRSHVLCEKPLTVFASDVAQLEKEAQEAGLLLGVGFQWSFARQNLLLKKHLLEGRYGKITGMRTFVNFRRNEQYYQSWHGNLYQKNGDLLLDSIISNATAHYLHFGLFMMGKQMDQSERPLCVDAALYRARKITSFDTCDVVCTFADGVKQKMLFTHSADGIRNILYYTIEMEDGIAEVNPERYGNEHLMVHTRDGEILDYNELSGAEGLMEDKINGMIEAVAARKEGRTDVTIPCHPATTLPFSLVCNGLFAELPIHDFPKERIVHVEDDGFGPFEADLVPGLFDEMKNCYEKNMTPREAGLDWALPYEHFSLSSAEEYHQKLCRKFG